MESEWVETWSKGLFAGLERAGIFFTRMSRSHHRDLKKIFPENSSKVK